MVRSSGITQSTSPVKTKPTWGDWGQVKKRYTFICLYGLHFEIGSLTETLCSVRSHTEANGAYCDNDLTTWKGEILHSSVACIACDYLFVKQKDQNYEISCDTCGIYWAESQNSHWKRLNGFAWGCVPNHMDASTSPHFIHVSFDINNASASSGVWNASKTIIKLPWKLRSCARVRHTVSAQITAWKVTANKALDRGAEKGEIKRREVRDGQSWWNNKSSQSGGFGGSQLMKYTVHR